MDTDLSIINLILEASPVVQLVMVGLFITSIASWTVIIHKRLTIRGTIKVADRFDEQFWSGVELIELYNRLDRRQELLKGMEMIFYSGFKEYGRRKNMEGSEAREMIEGAERSMRTALVREIDDMESHLSFLATVGSTSPYIGLFGTVWGIMNSFRALGTVQQATISMVAPGIAEALIATAMGLFAAIPAVIAYNRLVHDVERMHNRYDNFVEEFSAILQRQGRS
ncbi:MAG: protein TolQ [Ectothiorhodospiraceae bacterium AqS1]|nr:protein TolQ [Ectothiorhodospiraceae bacterium AqS1]